MKVRVLGAAVLTAAVLAASLGPPAGAEPGKSVPLFFIQRSKNANEVHYDARLGSDLKVDPRNPVEGYWLLKAHDGRREELNWVERVKAYGFDAEPEGPGAWKVILKAYDQRPVRVRQVSDRVWAEMTIAGTPAVLERIYIDSRETITGPKVNWLELFGRDPATGEPRTERIIPD